MQFKETCVKCCVLASFPADDGWEHDTARCLCRSEDKRRAFGITCSATDTSEVKLRRGWPLRGQQVSRIKWRLLRTSLEINSTLHRGDRSLVSRSLYDTSLHPSRLSSVALLLHSMSDETNTSGRKSYQSSHADESTTLLKTKNTLRFATTTPWFVGSWYVWSEKWCAFFLCPLWPVYRGKEICDPCVGFLSWLHRAVSTRQELCLNDLHNTESESEKTKSEKRIRYAKAKSERDMERDIILWYIWLERQESKKTGVLTSTKNDLAQKHYATLSAALGLVPSSLLAGELCKNNFRSHKSGSSFQRIRCMLPVRL